MMLLPQLRYILEVCHPQDAVVTNILEILIRVARHSLQSTHEVIEVCHLTRHYVQIVLGFEMSLAFEVYNGKFLPFEWTKKTG